MLHWPVLLFQCLLWKPQKMELCLEMFLPCIGVKFATLGGRQCFSGAERALSQVCNYFKSSRQKKNVLL